MICFSCTFLVNLQSITFIRNLLVVYDILVLIQWQWKFLLGFIYLFTGQITQHCYFHFFFFFRRNWIYQYWEEKNEELNHRWHCFLKKMFSFGLKISPRKRHYAQISQLIVSRLKSSSKVFSAWWRAEGSNFHKTLAYIACHASLVCFTLAVFFCNEVAVLSVKSFQEIQNTLSMRLACCLIRA